MTTKIKTVLLSAALAFVLGTGVATKAIADHDDDDDRVELEALVKAGNFVDPGQAREKALAAKPGTVTDVDLERSWRGGYYYEVEIVDPELRKWEVHIDAKTGNVESVRRDWFD